jgi:HSP20 family protein
LLECVAARALRRAPLGVRKIPGKEDLMALELFRPRRTLSAAPLERMNPLSEMTRIDRQMQDLFDRFLQDFAGRAAAPALDMIDRKDEIVVRADLPGLEKKDVEVEVQDGTLILRGQRAEEKEEKDENYYYTERWTGAFTRAVPLPPNVDTSQINATFKGGVLEVHLPKTKEGRGKKVEIKA